MQEKAIKLVTTALPKNGSGDTQGGATNMYQLFWATGSSTISFLCSGPPHTPTNQARAHSIPEEAKGKLRPTVENKQFRKITVDTVCSDQAEHFAAVLWDAQYAEGVSAAIEKFGTQPASQCRCPNHVEEYLIQLDAVLSTTCTRRE